MKFKVSNKKIDFLNSDISFLFTDNIKLLPKLLKKWAKIKIQNINFKNDVYLGYLITHKLIILKQKNLDIIDEFRNLSGKIYSLINSFNKKNLQIKTITIACDNKLLKTHKISDVFQAFIEGFLLSNYKFTKYKTENSSKRTELEIKFITETKIKNLNYPLFIAKTLCDATNFVKDLVNEPSDVITPNSFKIKILKEFKSSKKIKYQIFNKQTLKTKGFLAILSVAKGSQNPPYLIHLNYTPKKFKKRICLVGKGITFDSGGLDLKSSKAMQTMKIDMAGAGTVFGIFKALKQIDVPYEIYGIIPLCENMISYKALKPGDIIKTYSGKTIEVINTDAEGRLILADGLAYAQKFNPDIIIDLATLTGACIDALGENIAGIFSTNKKISEILKKSSLFTGEKIWELPLEESYKKELKSDIADLRNIPKTRYAGAIFGALFLKEFIKDNISWAHLDIAGPAYAENPINSYIKKGATGFGVRLILNALIKKMF